MADNFYARYPVEGGSGVTSLNTLTGALTLAAGSGITITPSGGDTLTIAATGGSGFATTELDNLTTTAINTDLIFGSGVPGGLATLFESTLPTQELVIVTGDASGSGDVSGNMIIRTGTALDATTGSMTVITGAPGGSGTSGDTFVGTGNSTTTSGALNLKTGSAHFSSGSLDIASGTTFGTGAAASGDVLLRSGNPGPDDNSGDASVKSGNATGTGVSGTVRILSGSSVDGQSGDVLVGSGASSGTVTSGAVNIRTGNSGDDSGGLNIFTGDAAAGNSGNITLQAGTAPSGTVGNVIISGGSDLLADNDIAATGTVTGSNLSGTNTGNVTLTAVGATPNANGASLSGQALTLQPANGTFPGVLTAADWTTFNGKQAAGNYITALTGDATASGPGSVALTLATVNGNVGSFGTATQVSTITVNAKGLITAASNTTIAIPFSQVTGTVPLNQGGTGQTTKAPAFDALSPMTTGGDLIYGGASGTGTRLANGSSGQVLTSAGGTSAPTWSAVPYGNQAVSAVKTTTYSILTTDNLVLVDGTSAFTATLPTAVGVTGKQYTIKRVDLHTANAVTVATTSSQTIDGSTTFKLMTQYEQITVVSDNSNWQIMDHSYPSKLVSWTPTFAGWGTVSSVSAFSRRVGDSLEFSVTFTSGTTTAVAATMTIGYGGTNSNVTIDTAKIIGTGNELVGTGALGVTTEKSLSILAAASDNTKLYFSRFGDATISALAAQIGSTVDGGSHVISFYAIVPITNWEG